MDGVHKRVFGGLFARRDALVLAFARAFESSLTIAPRNEVPQVEELFESAVPTLGTRLEAELPSGWRCRVSGSFVHGGRGRYLARRRDNGLACEIGDLLIVVEYRLPPSGSARNALLIQAKGAHAPTATPWSGSDSGEKQYALYSEWPAFDWEPGWIATQRIDEPRHLEPNGVGCPCRSGWGDHPGSHWSRWSDDWEARIHGGAVFSTLKLPQPDVLPPLIGHEARPLAAVCADLMLFTGGFSLERRHDAYRGAQLGWGAVIWDLLDASRQRTWRQRPDRSSDILLEDEESLDAGRLRAHHAQFDDDEQRGLSVVRLVVVAQE